MENIKTFESYNLSEGSPEDETPIFIEEAIEAISPIMERYYQSVEAADGDAENAIQNFKAKLIAEIEKL